jgi:hypothetical protein
VMTLLSRASDGMVKLVLVVELCHCQVMLVMMMVPICTGNVVAESVLVVA